jgi:hypothetical protein
VLKSLLTKNQIYKGSKMKTHITKNAIVIFMVVVFSMVLLVSNISFSQNNNVSSSINSRWSNIKFAIYFTYPDIENLLSDSVQFEKTMEYFAPVKPERVYLEGNSEGKINIDLLRKLKYKFNSMGIEVYGAMVPVSPHGGPSNYTNPEDLAALKSRMESLAKVFDNIILDDWLFTTATDEKSVKQRGNQSWAYYRTKLLLEQSKKYIIDPAKKVNPNVKVIIKYPDWYEGHMHNGYDVFNETNLYDKMAVGIETRNPITQDQHIPIYSGYIFQKWFSSVNRSKWIGSWLDNYGMKGEDNKYVAQVWQAIFAKSPEIILWCAGQLYPSTGPSSDVYPFFRDMLSEFDRVAGLINGPSRGIPIYLPYGSTGEYNIFGYLGEAGIPLTPVAKFPSESDNAIFTLHSLQDPKLADEMLARLRNGHDVFMTWKLWEKLKNTDFKNVLSLVDYGGTVTSSDFRIRKGWDEFLVKADKPFTFSRIETTTWPYVRDVAVVKPDYDFGVLLDAKYLNGNVYVLNMPDDSNDLLNLPTEVLNMIRRAFNKELGVTLEGPGNVIMYMYGQKQYVVYNLSNKEADISLNFTKELPSTGWHEILNSYQLSVKRDSSFIKQGGPVFTNVSFNLPPNNIAIIQAP